MASRKDPEKGGCETPLACPASTACLPGRNLPCVEVGRSHIAKLDLCSELEAIADALPGHVDRRKCLIVASTLVPLLRQSHVYEEECVFPAFAGHGRDRDARRQTIRRLKTEHVEDECAAQDLTDVLFAIGHGAPIDNPEALGFMLRAFFEGMRRHIAFEREHIFPAIAKNGESG